MPAWTEKLPHGRRCKGHRPRARMSLVGPLLGQRFNAPKAVRWAGCGMLPILFASADAQSNGGRYRIEPILIGGAGGKVSGDGFTLHGSFGQAATATLATSRYQLVGGFWTATRAEPRDIIFVDGFDGGDSP